MPQGRLCPHQVKPVFRDRLRRGKFHQISAIAFGAREIIGQNTPPQPGADHRSQDPEVGRGCNRNAARFLQAVGRKPVTHQRTVKVIGQPGQAAKRLPSVGGGDDRFGHGGSCDGEKTLGADRLEGKSRIGYLRGGDC